MTPWPSIILGSICSLILWFGVGNSLGLWLGGFAIVAILLPPMSVRRERWIHRVFDAGAVVDCVVVIWLLAVIAARASIGAWFQNAIALYAFSLAGFGIVLLLVALRAPALLASMIVTMATLAWLAAPVWMSPWMNGAIAGVLSDFHPLLAVNGQVTHLGIWLEQPIVYRHTVLGQDVPYSLPPNVWWCAGAHVAVGTVAILLACAVNRLASRNAPAPTAAASPL